MSMGFEKGVESASLHLNRVKVALASDLEQLMSSPRASLSPGQEEEERSKLEDALGKSFTAMTLLSSKGPPDAFERAIHDLENTLEEMVSS